MFNIDISDTVAVKQICEEGMLETARDYVLEVLDERFKVVPSDVIDRVKSIDRREILKSLLRQAVRSKKIEDFKQVLTQGTR